MQILTSAYCRLCCVQNYEPAFHLWFNNLCIELAQKSSEYEYRPEVTLCG